MTREEWLALYPPALGGEDREAIRSILRGALARRARERRSEPGRDWLDLLTTREVAEMLRCPESTVRNWRQAGYGPKHAKVGRRVLYSRLDVEKWWERQRNLRRLAGGSGSGAGGSGS